MATAVKKNSLLTGGKLWAWFCCDGLGVRGKIQDKSYVYVYSVAEVLLGAHLKPRLIRFIV